MSKSGSKSASKSASSKPAPPRPAPRLYLATPEVAAPEAFLPVLRELLRTADVAAILLHLASGDERTLINRAKSIAAIVQPEGVAMLLRGHADLVAREGADGAHLGKIDAFNAALPGLRPDRIAGVGGLLTRHDAMLAGEAGADYVLFGEPDAQGRRPQRAMIEERLQWWAELFEPPCVGYAAQIEEIVPFIMAGADFILLQDCIFSDPRGPQAAMNDADAALREAAALIADMEGAQS